LLEKSPKLLALQKTVEQTLTSTTLSASGQHDSKPFSPHLTLARLKSFQLQQMELEELPQIDEEISLSFEVHSIEVMESQLKRAGAQHTGFQPIPLAS
jgi:RNA 2',3'-cyclic 3'-phosphodiesterase